MKGISAAIAIVWLFTSSCATVFAGGNICNKKPLPGEPKRQIRPWAFVFDIVLGYGVGLGIDFATGAIYKPCERPQNNKIINGSFEWSETIDVPGVSQKELYQRGIEWYNEAFKDMRAVIQSQDKEAGTFYGKGTIRVFLSSDYTDYVEFAVNVAVKDGKYKYVFNNFTHTGSWLIYKSYINVNGGNLQNEEGNSPLKAKSWAKIKHQTQDNIISIIIPSLKAKMQKKSLSETF